MHWRGGIVYNLMFRHTNVRSFSLFHGDYRGIMNKLTAGDEHLELLEESLA